MIIDTKKVLLDFSNKPLMAGTEELTVGLTLSNILVAAQDGGKMKMYTLAERVYKEAEVDVDAADVALIKHAVDTTNIYSNIVCGFLLLMIENLKEEKPAK